MRVNKETIINGVIVSVAGSVITTVADAVVRFIGGEEINAARIAALFFIVLIVASTMAFALIVLLIRKKDATVEPTQESNTAGIARDGELGVVKIFGNWQDASAEIYSEINRAQNVDVLLQIGRSMSINGTQLIDCLKGAVERNNTCVRFVTLDLDSSHISKAAAEKRGHSQIQAKAKCAEWRNDVGYVQQKAVQIANANPTLFKHRTHDEGFIWRLIITNDYAFIQPYTAKSDNHGVSPVIKIAKSNNAGVENESSLYHVFQKHFVRRWNGGRESQTLLPIGADGTVAGIIKMAQFYVFAVPRRYGEADKDYAKFNCVGGKLGNDELYSDALIRETKEELGVNIEIPNQKSPRLFFRYKEGDAANCQATAGHYVLVYDAQLLDEETLLKDLKPSAEIAALVIVTSNTLQEIVNNGMTFEQINKRRSDGDGSRVVCTPDFQFDNIAHKNARPAGAAKIIINYYILADKDEAV
jgi:ADP-ribose pyrophosphatase YjhB (NUDIX family)